MPPSDANQGSQTASALTLAAGTSTHGKTETLTKKLGWPFVVLLAGILSFIPWLGSYGPLDPTDSFFLESGRESLELNQFLLPLNNYVPWLDKPILFFWLVAGAYKLLGVNVFAGRLPAALSAIATGLIIYAGCRPMLRRRTAALAALIFLSNPLTSIIGHVCLTDMTLCLFLTASILFLFKGIQYSSTRDLLIGYSSMSLAVLNKGPIAIILCGLAFLPYFILCSKNVKDFFRHLLSLKPLLGVAIVALVNLPWYIAATLATDGKFLIAFFWEQNFGRMMGTVNHQGPFHFYIPVYFAGLFPWSLFSASAPGILKSAWKRPAQPESTTHALRNILRLTMLWFACVMILFSAIKTKLPTYILPAIPAFAILVAVQLEQFFKLDLKRKLIPSILVSLVVVLGFGIAPLFLKGYVKDIVVKNLFLLTPLAVILSVYWMGIIRHKVKLPIAALLLCALLACGVVVPRGLISFYSHRQIGFSQLVMKAKEANASIAMLLAEEPSVPWLTHRPVSRLLSEEDAKAFLAKQAPPHYVLVPREMIKRLDWFPAGNQQIGESGKWHLFSVDR